MRFPITALGESRRHTAMRSHLRDWISNDGVQAGRAREPKFLLHAAFYTASR
jgi:hypothetical protein